jgi:hypothetical protein
LSEQGFPLSWFLSTRLFLVLDSLLAKCILALDMLNYDSKLHSWDGEGVTGYPKDSSKLRVDSCYSFSTDSSERMKHVVVLNCLFLSVMSREGCAGTIVLLCRLQDQLSSLQYTSIGWVWSFSNMHSNHNCYGAWWKYLSSHPGELLENLPKVLYLTLYTILHILLMDCEIDHHGTAFFFNLKLRRSPHKPGSLEASVLFFMIACLDACLGACLHWDKLKWNEVYPHKPVAAWRWKLLTSHISSPSQHHDLSLSIVSRNVTETQDADFISWYAWYFGQIVLYLPTPTVGSWWSQWLVMAVHHCYSWVKVKNIWHFVSDSHKVMTALSVKLPSNWCCADFSAISWMCGADPMQVWIFMSG